ncbi:iron ABC transporter substrate-binding protein [Candidatus Woesearchaeota archaeon]|nr:iron ABC transporter substrate-binding protein [Candidatus Woesearchaeota archaeon]
MAGREVYIPEKIERIVGIEAGALRLITYLDALDMVAGIEEVELQEGRPYGFAHPEIKEKPLIGPIHGGDAELILAQNPDLIFWTYTDAGKADELQERTGIPVIVLDYGDIDDQKETFYASLRLLGKVLGREKRSESVIQFFEDIIYELDERTKNNAFDGNVYIGGVANRGAHGFASTEPDYSAFRFLNVNNAASGIELEHAFIDPEQIITWNPDIIFIDESGYELVMNDLKNESAFYNTLDAVKQGEVYAVMPYNAYTTNYATVLANSYYIGVVLYPEQFSDIFPDEKADEIYKFLLGKPVYNEMKKMYGGFRKVTI